MRAIVVDQFGPPERLRVGEVAEPMPGPDEVLVRVHAVPVNYVDLLVVGGTYQFPPQLPFIPGKGPAGVVAALGETVTSLRIGDRVLAMAEQGGYAEAVTVTADQCYRLPPSMSFTQAASLSLVYDTAWFALRERARLETGETALVLGASGGVGQAAIQLARAMGARVLAGILRPERAPSVRAAGADVVLDPLGGPMFEAAVRALAWRGRLVVIGFTAGAIPTIRMNYLLLKNIEISGLQISDYRKRCPAQVAACFAEIFSLYEEGMIRPAEAIAFPLARAGEALAALRDRRIAGRAVLQPDQQSRKPSADDDG